MNKLLIQLRFNFYKALGLFVLFFAFFWVLFFQQTQQDIFEVQGKADIVLSNLSLTYFIETQADKTAQMNLEQFVTTYKDILDQKFIKMMSKFGLKSIYVVGPDLKRNYFIKSGQTKSLNQEAPFDEWQKIQDILEKRQVSPSQDMLFSGQGYHVVQLMTHNNQASWGYLVAVQDRVFQLTHIFKVVYALIIPLLLLALVGYEMIIFIFTLQFAEPYQQLSLFLKRVVKNEFMHVFLMRRNHLIRLILHEINETVSSLLNHIAAFYGWVNEITQGASGLSDQSKSKIQFVKEQIANRYKVNEDCDLSVKRPEGYGIFRFILFLLFFSQSIYLMSFIIYSTQTLSLGLMFFVSLPILLIYFVVAMAYFTMKGATRFMKGFIIIAFMQNVITLLFGFQATLYQTLILYAVHFFLFFCLILLYVFYFNKQHIQKYYSFFYFLKAVVLGVVTGLLFGYIAQSLDFIFVSLATSGISSLLVTYLTLRQFLENQEANNE